MFWCDYCKVWMNDNPATKATHENGLKHKDMVARKLRQMRQKQDQEKRDLVESQRSMSSIEAAAQRQYQADLKAAEESKRQRLGEWVKDEGSGYHYNAAHRWYYDTATSMYYGGEPATWTKVPDLPDDAKYEAMAAPAAVTGPGGQDMGPSTSGRLAGAPQGVKRKSTAAHPLTDIGGYKMPTTGRIGGAKGIGASAAGVTKRKGQPTTVTASKSSKPVSKEEADAIAAREAAKRRVQQRTLSTFGLG
ncbi:hypothetical protein ABBQ38_005388 [Trebouxia sp. C0009 RCD-2024]